MIACGGAGKTTLARDLGKLLSLPVLHIDGYYWRDVQGQRDESRPEQPAWTERGRPPVGWLTERTA